MKAQQLSENRRNASAGPIRPGDALVPQEIVQNGSFHGEARGQQIIHLHRDECSQHTQLHGNPHGSHQRETNHTEA